MRTRELYGKPAAETLWTYRCDTCGCPSVQTYMGPDPPSGWMKKGKKHYCPMHPPSTYRAPKA